MTEWAETLFEESLVGPLRSGDWVHGSLTREEQRQHFGRFRHSDIYLRV